MAPAQTPPDAPADTPPGRAETGATPRDRRILSLWLPDFAMERRLRQLAAEAEAPPEDLPLALGIEGRHGPVIHAHNRAAGQAGVRRGARVADMRALCPGLRVDHADPGADRMALDRLMLWSRRWCPWTATDGTDALVMDVTGATHLWGGEAQMLREIEGRLGTLGLTARLAIAPTRAAAWALARFGPHRSLCAPDQVTAQTGALPLAALRLEPATVQLLSRLGLRDIAALTALPRLGLARRFARDPAPRNPLIRLDQLTGRLAEPIAPPADPPRFVVQARLAEPVRDAGALIPRLAADLCRDLAAAGFGARRLILTLYRCDGELRGTHVATARASRDPAHLARLFDGRLEGIDPGFGFDLVTLAADMVEMLDEGQGRLDGGRNGGTQGGEATARLIDRLTARFGPGRLTRPVPRPGHIPERRIAWAPAIAADTVDTGPAVTPAGSDGRRPRPMRLFAPPEEIRVLYAVPDGPPVQFVWRRVTQRVVRFDGPERIAPEWWVDCPGTRLRDYYVVETQGGSRLWMYREGVLGDGRGGPPRWLVHGTFA